MSLIDNREYENKNTNIYNSRNYMSLIDFGCFS